MMSDRAMVERKRVVAFLRRRSRELYESANLAPSEVHADQLRLIGIELRSMASMIEGGYHRIGTTLLPQQMG
jgi:hypothetical protein